MTGITNAREKYFTHYITVYRTNETANLRIISPKAEKYNSFSEVLTDLQKRKAIMLDGFDTLSANKYFLFGIQAIGSSGQTGTPYIMFIAYNVSTWAVSNPMFEVGNVTSINDDMLVFQ